MSRNALPFPVISSRPPRPRWYPSPHPDCKPRRRSSRPLARWHRQSRDPFGGRAMPTRLPAPRRPWTLTRIAALARLPHLHRRWPQAPQTVQPSSQGTNQSAPQNTPQPSQPGSPQPPAQTPPPTPPPQGTPAPLVGPPTPALAPASGQPTTYTAADGSASVHGPRRLASHRGQRRPHQNDRSRRTAKSPSSAESWAPTTHPSTPARTAPTTPACPCPTPPPSRTRSP